MKLTRSLLLGTAAGFAAVAGAQAADLPVRKAAPVEYVRVCSLGGGAFVGYVIPGSDICLRVGGFARYQYSWNPPSNSFLNVLPGGLVAPGTFGTTNGVPNRGYYQRFSGQSATGALILDARTQTEYGLARAFIDMRVGEGFNESGAYIDKAWLQLGGFQAGKYQSYFDFYADAFNNIGQLGSDHSAIGAAYTAIFGNFSAAVSVEDYVGTNGVASSTFGLPNYYGGLGGTYDPALGLIPGGYRMPDIVGRLLYADAWGQVQLSGALHQVRATTFDVFGGQDDNTKYGWAVQGGVKVNAPMFGPSDALYLQAAYAEGALLYIGANGTRGFGQSSQLTFGSDALATGDGGSLKLTKGWNALAAFSHSWTPTISTALWGGYTAVDYSGSYITGTVDPLTGIGLPGRDFHYWQVGAQANWSPIRNLTVAGTVNYVNTQAKRLAFDPIAVGSDTYFRRSTDGVQFAVRVQRDF